MECDTLEREWERERVTLDGAKITMFLGALN